MAPDRDGDDRLSFVFGEEVAYLYYANHTTRVRGSGRIVAQSSQSKTYSVLLPNGEILNKIFFVKRLSSKESSGSAAQVNSVFDQESGESRRSSRLTRRLRTSSTSLESGAVGLTVRAVSVQPADGVRRPFFTWTTPAFSRSPRKAVEGDATHRVPCPEVALGAR